MGRHMIASSPLRSPAVIIGVPVATVLATVGSNAMLGGVIPSAEGMPLRAETVVDAPAEPLPGPPSWPSSWSPSATEDILDGIAPGGLDSDLPGDARGRAENAASGTIRVVPVSDESTSTVRPAPRADGIRVVRKGAERVAERGVPRERTGPRAEGDERPLRAFRPASAVSAPAESVVSEQASVGSGSPTDRVERVSTVSPVTSSDREDGADGSGGGSGGGGGLVDLDTPARGLSVLSFS